MTLFPLSGRVRTALRWTGGLLLALYFAAGLLILVGRHLLMPELAGQRELIEQKLSAAIGLPVKIAAVSAAWPGLHPQLGIEGLQIHDPRDPGGQPAFAFDRVAAEIGWSSLLFLELRLHRLEIVAPQLEMRRDAAGTLFVAGLPIRGEGDGGFADWLLEQRRIVVRDAHLVWRDELRGAPPLELRQVNFELRNFGSHHGFGLTARPSAAVAAAIDLRGNLAGNSAADPAAWHGEFYADIAAVDLAAWSPWLDLPLEMTHGRGGLRLWLEFANLLPTGFTADVHLADFSARLRPDLPPLAVSRLDGRLAGRRAGDELAGEIRRLTLATPEGIEVQPLDATLRLVTRGRSEGGELRANSVDLGILAELADRVPLPAQLHEVLRAFAPRGRIADLALTWQGRPEAPTGWQARGAFAGLALAAHKELPGFAGISGRLDGDERAGTVVIDSRDAQIHLPAVFPEPTLALAAVEGQVDWRRRAGTVEFQLPRMVFHNDDASGEANGSYRYTGQGPGEIDLSARLTRAAGDAVWRYMPLVVNREARDWLRAGIVGGRADNAALRLKGPLAEFPFADGKGGIFQVKSKVHGALLSFAPGWPRMTGIDGDLLFEGVRMEIRAQRGDIMGVALSDMLAVIPALDADEQVLTVTGRARGETQRFLDFIEASPVGARIDHFTEAMAAPQGQGELDLKLVMPLSHVADTQVQGRYRFADNRLQVLPVLPPFTDAQGELSFTAERLQAKNLRARLLDQPLTLEVTSAPGGVVRVAAAGTLAAQGLRSHYGLRAFDHLSGETPWRGTVTVKRPSAEIRIESALDGLNSSLPDPFNKSARDRLPLTVTGRIDPQRDEWSVALGDTAALRLQQENGGWRGTLALGAAVVKAPPAPPAQGVALGVALPALDLDDWRPLLANGTGGASGANGGNGQPAALPSLAAIDLRSEDLHVMRRHFHGVRLQGTRSGTRWNLGLDSREAQGQLNWDGSGAGRIGGRLSRLHLPAAAGAEPEIDSAEAAREMPAIDLAIDSFRLGEMALGEAKVKAENREGAWQAKFDVRNDAARLTGDGRWRPSPTAPETALAFKLDMDSAEKLLDRLGLPDAVRHGDGRIEGDVRWRGNPLALDFASLSGRVKADIGKGQFKKLEPGVGRLLGVLSLQSLPRRITLDFRDIFSEGFAFDSIVGEARIARGVMTTDELRIRGPAAKILLSGQANLVAETQDLKVRVQPALGESLAVGAMLAHPAAGAVAWAAQKILNDPLDQIFAYEYAVTGAWSDPKVEKIQARPAESPTPP